ncbi:COX15/CtaA family protein [Ferviditalea candida]|uniref:COX15/CtaA family protein n=1 Tax=Ferviditalea candida TaxID=3108399 RepID=A0ABU5ZL44_9BACL|nr:COX15/CtaA family protein [Paenibacillaceae bacterium T2]
MAEHLVHASGRKRLSPIKWLSAVTLTGLFLINLMGFVDSETGSTFGCGRDWPLCNGKFVPSAWDAHTFIEFSHRAVVGFVTILLVALSVWAVLRYRGRKHVKALAAISLIFVGLQAMLGAMAVFFVNPPAVLALHFGFSLIAFSGVLLMTISIWKLESDDSSLPRNGDRFKPLSVSIKRWIWTTLVYVYGAVYFGAYVSRTGAGDKFRGWPFPQESWMTAGNAVLLDYIHRSIALGLIVLMINLYIRAYLIRKTRPDIFRGTLLALLLMLMQALSGGLLIATRISLDAFLLHVSIMTFLFGSLSYLGIQTLQTSGFKLKGARTK